MTKNCENRFIFLSHFLVLQVVLYSGYWLLQGSSLSIQLFSYLVQETIQEQKKDVTIRSPNSTLRPSAKSYLRNHCLLLMAIPASQSSITDHNRRVICSYLIYVWHCITNFRHLSFSTSMWLEKITLKSRVSGEKWSLNSLAHIPISLILLSYIRTTGEQLFACLGLASVLYSGQKMTIRRNHVEKVNKEQYLILMNHLGHKIRPLQGLLVEWVHSPKG